MKPKQLGKPQVGFHEAGVLTVLTLVFVVVRASAWIPLTRIDREKLPDTVNRINTHRNREYLYFVRSRFTCMFRLRAGFFYITGWGQLSSVLRWL